MCDGGFPWRQNTEEARCSKEAQFSSQMLFFFLIKVAFKYYCFPHLVTVSVLSDNTNECLLCARQCTKCCGEQKAFCDLIII